MSKVVKAVFIGALIAVGLAVLLPLVGLSAPFAGLFGIQSNVLAALVGGGLIGGLSTLLAPSLDLREVRARTRVSIDPNATMKWIFGETALATDIIFTVQHGADDKFYTYIIAGAGHLIDSFGDLYINGDLINFSGAAATGEWAGALWRQNRIGTDTQPSIQDIDGADDFAPGLWPATADGLGMAHYRLRWDVTHAKISSGVPTRITQIGKGGPVYDPRLDSTRGGVGTHRADDQTTWEYNDGTDDIGANWALIVLRYLIGWQINGKLVIGMGIDPDDIDMDQAMAAANVCEALVDGVPRYRIGGILPVTNDHSFIIRQLEGAINGKVATVGGKYFIWAPNDDLTPFSTIDEVDLLRDAGVIFTPSGPMEKLFNTGRGSYVSSAVTDLFNLVPYPDVIESAAVTEDGGVRVKNHDLSMVQDLSIAQRVVRGIVRRSRFGASWRFAMGPKGLTFQPFTVTTLNCQETNNTNVTVRIIDMAYSVSGAVVIEVIEEDSSIYDTTAALGTPVTQLDPGGFDPNTKIAVTGLTSIDISVRGDQGTATDGLKVTWDDPGQWVQETQVQYKVATETDFQSVPIHKVDLQTAIILPVEKATLYDIRARHISRSGVVGDFTSIQDTTGDAFAGIQVGLVAQLTYDDLDTTQLAAGQSRYAMLTDVAVNTSGSQNDFHLTDGILINKTDKGGITHRLILSEIREGDRIIFRVTNTKWFIFAVTDTKFDVVGSGAGEAYKFDVLLLDSSDPDPAANIPETAGTDVTFEIHKSQFDIAQQAIIDPDFDLSPLGTGGIVLQKIDNGVPIPVVDALRDFVGNSVFWGATYDMDTDAGTTGLVYSDPTVDIRATGVGGSNALFIQMGPFDSTGAPEPSGYFQQVIVWHVHRFRANAPSFDIKLRVRNQGVNDVSCGFQLEGYATPRSTSILDLGDFTFSVPGSTSTYIDLIFHMDQSRTGHTSAQYWQFMVRILGGASPPLGFAGDARTQLEIDSVFVTASSPTFGSVVSFGTVQEGVVPKASAADAAKVLQGDGTWVVNTGGGATQLSDLTDVNTSTPTNRNVLIADGVDWESRAFVAADVEFAVTDRFLGRDTVGGGDGEELTGTQATALLDNFTSTLKGLAPLSGGGTVNFLRADGTWAVPPDTSGPVDSVFGRTGAVVALTGDYAAFYPELAGTETISGAWTFTGANLVTGGSWRFNDDVELRFGTGNDARMYWQPIAGDLRIDVDIGNFHVRMNGVEQTILAVSNAGVSLAYNGIFKFETTIDGIKVTNSLYMEEQAFANADIPTEGQFWVRNDTPNTPMFTTDTGVDIDLSVGVTQLSDLSDVNTSTPTNRNVLIADGVDWESRQLVAADVQFAATARFLARNTAGAGDGEEITGTQATALLDNFTSTLKGLAPLSGGGSANFLRADGVWSAPAGGIADGTVINQMLRWDNSNWVATSQVRASATGVFSIFAGDLSRSIGISTNAGTNEVTIAASVSLGDLAFKGWDDIIIQDGATLFMEEVAAARIDVVARGQWWVRNDVPNAPMFTTDTGVDGQLARLSIDEEITGAYTFKTASGIRIMDAGGTDHVVMKHDGTDLLWVWTNTANWRIANVVTRFTGSTGIDSDSAGFFVAHTGGGSATFSAKGTAGYQMVMFGAALNFTFANFGVATGMVRIEDGYSLGIEEKAAANADVAGIGQFWVKNTAPCEFWFTDDTGVDEFHTQNSDGADHITGAAVKHRDGSFYEAGLGVMPRLNFTTATTILAAHWHKRLVHNGTADVSLNLTFNTLTTVPQDIVMWVLAKNGPVVLVDGTMVLNFYAGTGAPAVGNITIARGGWATIVKDADSVAHVTGVGLS